MIKVIIADDEALICDLIFALGNWKEYDMEVVAVAYNGLQALELVTIHQPNLIITDIRMPGCSGLELIEQIKQQHLQTNVVVISGHTEFSYAQQAIDLGVLTYLLKPVTKEDLNGILKKIHSKISSERAANTQNRKMHRKLLHNQQKARLCYIEEAIRSDVVTPTVEQVNWEYSYHFEEGLFFAFALVMDCDNPRHNQEYQAEVLLRARNTLLDKLRSIIIDQEIEMQPVDNILIGIGNVHTTQTAKVHQALSNGLKQIYDQNRMFPEFLFAISCGMFVNDISKLPQSMRSAKELLKERLILSDQAVITSAHSSNDVSILSIISPFMEHLMQGIQNANQARCKELFAQLPKLLTSKGGISGRDCCKALDWIVARIQESYADDLVENNWYESYLSTANQKSSLTLLVAYVEELVLSHVQFRGQKQANNGNGPIEFAKQYLECHYAENISLEQLSTEVGFSSSYFSSLFKKEVGIGLLEYATQLRVEKAKQLLLENQLSLSEICEAVGYHDIKHFNKTFKKATGLRPSEFKLLFGVK